MSARVRECRACEAKGWNHHMVKRLDTGAMVPHTGRGRILAPWARMLKACQLRLIHTSAREWLIVVPCLACRGTGRVEERIGPEDAVADAETLWREWLESDMTDLRPYWRTLDISRPIRKGHLLIAGMDATTAARAVFAAVPGLRG